MLKSKRFIGITAAGLIFVIGTFFFHQSPIEFASAIGILLTPYLAAESLKPSDKITGAA